MFLECIMHAIAYISISLLAFNTLDLSLIQSIGLHFFIVVYRVVDFIVNKYNHG